jgi:hypothetical protein
MIQMPPSFAADPALMARRLFDILIFVVMVLALDYVAAHAQFIRDFLSGVSASSS